MNKRALFRKCSLALSATVVAVLLLATLLLAGSAQPAGGYPSGLADRAVGGSVITAPNPFAQTSRDPALQRSSLTRGDPVLAMGERMAAEGVMSSYLQEAQSENVELVGQIGGAANAVVVQGDYAYIGGGPRLVALNVSDLASPTMIGQTTVMPGIVQDVFVAGNYAYVADENAGLRVIDVSDPTALVAVGTYYTPGDARGVYVADIYAYVADGNAGLRVIDVSDPTAPVEVGFYDEPCCAVGVYVADNYAYVANSRLWENGEWMGEDSLRVIDVSNPAAPMEVGVYDTLEEARGVYVAGDYAYVAGGFGGLRVVDISNPTAPMEVGAYETPGGGVVLGIHVTGTLAYVASAWSGLQVIDISNPAAPGEIGAYNAPGGAWGVYVTNAHAYVIAGSPGLWKMGLKGSDLRVVDVSDPTAPTEVGVYGAVGWPTDVHVDGAYTYMTDDFSGLRTVDVSNPAGPVAVGFYDSPGGASSVYITDTYAYVADWRAGLRVVDISDPSAPMGVGAYSTPGAAYGVYVVEGFAYVAAGDAGLRVVDVSNPTAPVEVGADETLDFARGVQVAGGYAYVVGDPGLEVIDISDSAAPVEVSTYDTPGFAENVYVAGKYTYVADGDTGLRVIDVSNPVAPMEVGAYDTPGWANDVHVVGGYAYMADWSAGLRVVDVTNPAAPREVGVYDTPGDARGIYVAGGYAYVADWEGGLFILRFTGGEPEPRPGENPPTRQAPGVDRENDDEFIEPVTDTSTQPGRDAGYKGRSDSPIEFDVEIDRYYGERNPDGMLKAKYYTGAEKSVASNAVLTIMAYDVDCDPGSRCEYDPNAEKDQVFVNGQSVGFLTGRDGWWFPARLNIPTGLLKFPDHYPNESPAHNTIRIDIDTQNKGWKTEIAWAKLKIPGARPVLLVPGYGGGAQGYFDEFEIAFRHAGLLVETTYFEGSEWLSKQSIQDNAYALKGLIGLITRKYGVEKINLVAHSKGGMDARGYISDDELYYDDVERLVTVSSPHRGLWLADVLLNPLKTPLDYRLPGFELTGRELAFVWPEIVTMAAGWQGKFCNWLHKIAYGNIPCVQATWNVTEEFVNEEFNPGHPAREGVSYYTVLADATEPNNPGAYSEELLDRYGPTGHHIGLRFLYGVVWDLSDYGNNHRNDGFIGTRSQSLREVAGHVNHTNTWALRPAVPEDHESSRLASSVLELIIPVLISFSPPSLAESSLATPASEPTVSIEATQAMTAPVSTLMVGDVITQSTALTLTLPVDSDQEIKFDLLWTEGDLYFDLLTPSGRPITTTTPLTDPDVTYNEARTQDGSGGGATYTISTPEPGDWTVNLSAAITFPHAITTTWLLALTQESSLQMTLDTDRADYTVGDTVIIRATLNSDTLPVVGARVEADIGDPSGNLMTLTLSDDGSSPDDQANDGVYSASFTATQAGVYGLSAVASGVAPNGATFNRVAIAQAVVSPGTASLSHSFSDVGIDLDGDGLFDILRVNVGLDIAAQGEYRVHGVLANPDGSELTWANRTLTLTVGSQIMPLDFDGSLLAAKGASGNLRLTQVLVEDLQAGLRVDTATDVYTTTTAYQPDQFQAESISLDPVVTDQGVDTNANSKYDLLRINLSADTRYAGDYTIVARLTDSDWQDIALAAQTVELISGTNSIQLDFDGQSINLSGLDGPYGVKDLVIALESGPAVSRSIADFYTTQAYNHTDFDSFSAPTITAISPNNVTNNMTATVTISGTNFLPVPTIAVGTTSLISVTYVTSTTLTATVPFGIAPGTYNVMVTNPDTQYAVWPAGFTVCHFADFDCNCSVETTDVMEVAARWRTSDENPDPDNDPNTFNYDPLYDIDKDGDIDVVDIMLVATYWGETCGTVTKE